MKSPMAWFINALKTDILPQPLREAYLPVGQTVDADDADWRPLSGDALRDLLPMNQRRMQDLAAYLWESNTLANRLIELPIAYILADGVRLKAEDENVQEVLNRFWNHPVNNMDIKLIKKVRELSMYGEQCYPAFVNEYSGAVRLGYLDPCLIGTVVVDPDNGEQPIGIVTVLTKKGVSKRYKVIVNGAEEEMFTQRTIAIRDTFTDGDCFYFKINDLASGRRGRSDLLSQIDWLDSYDQFLFGELDRIQFLRAFMWDVTLNGANEEEVKRKASSIRPPKPGSVRVHNDAEQWKAESPKIESADTDNSARLFRNHVLGGATIPEHWFGGGGDVNRATGEDMSNPTFKIMSLRQAFIGYMLLEMGRYCIRQWEIAHTGKEPDLFDSVYALSVSFPEMVTKDVAKYAAALREVTQAVSIAINDKLMSVKTGIAVIESIAGRLGVGFDAEAELAAIAEQVPKQNVVQSSGQDLTDLKQQKITEAVANGLQNLGFALPKQADTPEQMTDLLSQTAQPVIDEMLKTIIAMLESSEDIPDALNKLNSLFPEMDNSDLTDLLSQAMQAGFLAGFNSDVAYPS